ncbi:glutamine--tRNA ligase/YqeY domain fusion protein [Paenibacillus sp. strain BS8-2]
MNNGIDEHKEGYLIELIREELKESPFHRTMTTRFPPEPNGYLHIGSAYAIRTNAEIAKLFCGSFHLRFDDTNPLKEDMSYVEAIIEDIRWLGYDPGHHIYYSSDYFERIFDAAMLLITRGKAYVCDLTPNELAASRGTLTEPGQDSPYRKRSIEENIMLFEAMREGRFDPSSKVLRARIDMASPNMNMRDPVLYRIIHADHYRTGSEWCIYPMYDFAHPIQDTIEGITYSLCSLEFKDHRPLYEWVLEELGIEAPPRQREFGRLGLTGVVTSKRYLRQLVEGGFVDGWDDPRLPTLRGLRRRGYTPASIRAFIDAIGSIRSYSTVDISLLDQCLRQDLKDTTISVMAVLRPLKVVITNYPEGQTESLTIENSASNPALGTRKVPFSRTLYIEQSDFAEDPPPGFHRLRPGGETRLKGAYYIQCNEVIKDPATGEIIELRCTYDYETKSGSGFNGRKVKGTIHWVSAEQAACMEVKLYDRLLLAEDFPKDEEVNWAKLVNPDSLIHLNNAMLEPYIREIEEGERLQFFRHGYFVHDSRLSTDESLSFNRIVPLKDSWTPK